MVTKLILLLVLFYHAGSYMVCAQSTPVQYGNNEAAGRYYDIRGCKLYTEIYGSGPALLLLHGNGGSISAFFKTIPYFAKKYKVIAVDSRAHGRSIDTKDSLSFEQMADDFAVLLDSMNVDSAYVLGWSDGGISALLLAMRHPNKIKKLTASGANLWPDSTALLPSVWKEEFRYYKEQKNKQQLSTKDKLRWKVFLLDWKQPNIGLAELSKIKCASLIISGDRDVIRLEHTLLIYQHIPGANLWVIPKSGHGTLIEHSEEVNKHVDKFFETP